jgi:hypothetical protein
MTKISLSLLVLAYGLLGAATVHAQTIPLAPKRLGHAETLLRSGQVLITGGQNENATLDSALLYDPATGSFAATGALITAREEHTSTLLPDGTVLIAGGEKDKVALQTAEIYDPASGRFTEVRRGMTAPRTKHTATSLRNGQVLLVSSGTAETYDPVRKRFRATKGMPANRKSHSAVLLSDGTVLIMGGYINGISSRTAEIYHPSSQDFTPLTAEMNLARANHTGTLLLDDTALLAGDFRGRVRTMKRNSMIRCNRPLPWQQDDLTIVPTNARSAWSTAGFS